MARFSAPQPQNSAGMPATAEVGMPAQRPQSAFSTAYQKNSPPFSVRTVTQITPRPLKNRLIPPRLTRGRARR